MNTKSIIALSMFLTLIGSSAAEAYPFFGNCSNNNNGQKYYRQYRNGHKRFCKGHKNKNRNFKRINFSNYNNRGWNW